MEDTDEREDHPATELPFVKDIPGYLRPESGLLPGSSRRFWVPEKVGSNYWQAAYRGERLAVQTMRWIVAADFSPILNWIVQDMPKAEEASEEERGLQAGFLGTFGALVGYFGSIPEALDHFEHALARRRASVMRNQTAILALEDEDDEEGGGDVTAPPEPG